MQLWSEIILVSSNLTCAVNLYDFNLVPRVLHIIPLIECFHSRGQHLCKCIGTKGSVCMRKELNSQRIGLGHQHGHRFIVLGHRHVKTLSTLFHLCIRKPVNTPYTGMFRLCHEVLFSACYNLRISLIELIKNSIAVIENEIMAAVTSGLLTIVKTGITIVRCFGNVTTSLFALTIGRKFTPL